MWPVCEISRIERSALCNPCRRYWRRGRRTRPFDQWKDLRKGMILPIRQSVIGQLRWPLCVELVRGTGGQRFEGVALDTILRVSGVDTLVLVGIATDIAVESIARVASDPQYRTIFVCGPCQADSDETHSARLRSSNSRRDCRSHCVPRDRSLQLRPGRKTRRGWRPNCYLIVTQSIWRISH
jgi:hypothetical protein